MQFLRRIILIMIASVSIAVNAFADVPASQGQKFKTLETVNICDVPYDIARYLSQTNAAEITLIEYDPKTGWATTPFIQDDGHPVGYVRLEQIDFPGGQKIRIKKASIGSNESMLEDEGKPYSDRGPGNGTVRVTIYYILFGILLIIPVIYRILSLLDRFGIMKFGGQEFRFVILTSCAAVVCYLFWWIFSVEDHMDFMATLKFWYVFREVLVCGAAIFCAWPLLKWSWSNVKALIKKDSVPLLSKLRTAIPSLIFILAITYLGLTAVRGVVMGILYVAIAVFAAYIALRMATNTLGSSSSGGSGGIDFSCSSCAHYSDSKCNLNPGAMVSDYDSCRNYRK